MGLLLGMTVKNWSVSLTLPLRHQSVDKDKKAKLLTDREAEFAAPSSYQATLRERSRSRERQRQSLAKCKQGD